jgi:hypothetical protein
MKLEKAIPLLREGKSISRINTSWFHALLIVKLQFGTTLRSKHIYKNGKEEDWKYYKFSSRDLLVDDWEIIE